jgi:thiopeptide-type bacteriocin biosynthesis protein
MSKPASSNDEFISSGFFALRTPLLPFDELLAWSAGLESATAGDDLVRLEAACSADWACLRTRLGKVYERPEVREALFVASPDLEERFDRWLQEPDSDAGRKIERALVRYFARMAGRATPFGLFAGCSVGTVTVESRLVLAARARYKRHTRLDMDYLVILTDALARVPDVRCNLAFAVNTSLHATPGRFRYFEVRRDGKGWTHHQVALEASSYLVATLARAAGGAKLEALEEVLLAHDPEASQQEAEEYIAGLIDNQVLVSELRPTVTGAEPIVGLAHRLREPAAPSISDRLAKVHDELGALDKSGLGVHPGRYRHLAETLAALPGEVNLSQLFQVDMVKPVDSAYLGKRVLAEIAAGVRLLHRLTRRPQEDRLSRFREAFVKRYEGREVPLVEALDEETGIGFDPAATGSTDASSLLDDLKFPKPAEETVAWGKCESHLLSLLSNALARGAAEINLTPSDLEAMAQLNPPPLPDAFAVMARIAAESEKALADGDFQVFLEGASGPSGARLLGRFCHADAELHRHVEQHVRAEEALEPDAVFAEIVHLPEGRLGNILARPVLRAYEIPYLGTAGVPAERQIPLTDLRVSVVDGQIVLRSVRLGRRIIPRLTSAHNFHMSQGIYWFLCALQSQGTIGDMGWNWGPLHDAPFLPRVVHGRLVLSRATWRVTSREVKPLAQARGAKRFRAVQTWRVNRRLPRWIVLVDADNELPIDLDNVLAVDTFLELVKAREHVALVELFPGPDQLWARGPEGRFMHELVVPFTRDKETMRQGDRETAEGPGPPPLRSLSPCLPISSFDRSFPLGSEWLYAKLYTGPATLDQLLLHLVKPLVESVTRSGAADRWFFIRYGDPEWQLRLRFHGDPARLRDEILPVLQDAAAPLLCNGRLWRIQFDTYEREIERYGGPEGIELAERLFHADSEAVLLLAEWFPGDTRGDLRWRLALVGMDLLLSEMEFDSDTRLEVIRKARDSFAKEFRADAPFKHQLATKFRTERRRLEALLDDTEAADVPTRHCLEILRQRSKRLTEVLNELKALARDGRLFLPLTELAPSYLHMHANRLLRSAQRAQELVLYDFLCRLYESRAARMQSKI